MVGWPNYCSSASERLNRRFTSFRNGESERLARQSKDECSSSLTGVSISVALSHLSTGTVAQAKEALNQELWFMLAGLNCSHGGWRPPGHTAASPSRGLWANSDRYGLGFLLGVHAGRKYRSARESIELGEYGADDYSDRCCTSARVTASGGR